MSLPEALPVPPHYDPDRVGEVWRVPYEERAAQARGWAAEHDLPPVADDDTRVLLVLVDVQNTFCLPDFELFVAGRSGTGAVDDNRRLCEWVYRHLGWITTVCPTMDTHQAMQIFHAPFLVDEEGNHPDPLTVVTEKDVASGRWQFNPDIAAPLGVSPDYGQRYLEHYVEELAEREKYALMIWPYHAMLGGIGHALVSAVEEAVFFHTLARYSNPIWHVKGDEAFTEHYSALSAEVTEDQRGAPVADPEPALVDLVEDYDITVIAGQAKSHCVAWTIDDLANELSVRDPDLNDRVYLLEDCTSPVVIPDVVDYTDAADEAFARAASIGMHRVTTKTPIGDWPSLG